MKHAISTLGVLLACSLAMGQAPRGLPPAIVPDGFGVNIHFVVPNEAEMDALADVGYRFIRMDFAWGGIERNRGEYDFSGYDKLVESLARRNIRALFILDYGNRLYDGGASPFTDEGRSAFAKWAGAAAKHFAGKGIIWEIWNEPNIFFWKPKPNVDDYSKLALATIDAVRQADPQAFIIGPASSEFPWAFFEGMAKHGVFNKLDAVSVHPYRQRDPETAAADYHRLRLFLSRVCPERKLPIVSGEWGYSTGWKNMPEEKQAQYLPRQWLTNLANDVHLSIWYDWKDDGADPKEPEHHFGSVYRDLKPKPAAKAAKTLTTALQGHRFLRRLASENPADHLLLFARKGGIVLAAWTTAEPHKIDLPVPAGSQGGTLIDPQGGRHPATFDSNSRVQLNLGAAPIFLDIPTASADGSLGSWRPAEQVSAIEAGPNASLSIEGDQHATGEVRVEVAGQLIGTQKTGGKDKLTIPLRLTDRSQPATRATVRFVTADGKSDPWDTASITLLIVNSLSASSLPPIDGKVGVQLENPSGQALRGTMRATAGTVSGSTPLELAARQKQAIIAVPLPSLPPDTEIRIEATDSTGNALLQLAPVRWHPITLADNQTWKTYLDGDAKQPGSAAVKQADAITPLPQPGITKALQIDYKFSSGWRFARITPPAALASIEGKPKAVGMWVYGDNSENLLRCRFADSTNQFFQPDFGPIDWAGWKWVTIPLDGAHAGHWGGANDGTIHYPIRWDTLLLIDNAKFRVDQDLRIQAAGMAVQY